MSMIATPSDSADAPGRSQRLHPSSLLFSLGSAARRLLIPGIIVLFASRGDRTEVWLMALFVPAALAALAKFLSYRYRLGREELVVREGIVTRNERHIPYSRIQNIDLVQNPLHRMLGVAEARLETASGDKPEAVIRVLSLQAVERMRARVFEERDRAAAVTDGGDAPAAASPADEPPRRLVELTSRELMLLGVMSNRGLAMIAAAMGMFWQFSRFRLDDQVEKLAQRLETVPDALPVSEGASTWIVAVAGAIAILVVVKLLSVIWIVLKYYRFKLTLRGDDLRAEYGLFTHVSATIPRHRIQVLSTRHGPVQRRLRRVSVQVETAGGGEGEQGGHGSRLWIAPQMREEGLARLLGEVLPGIDFDALDWRELEPRVRWRVFRKTLIVASIAVAGITVAIGPWGLLLELVAVPLAFIRSALYVRHTRYAMAEGFVAYRSGWLRRTVSAVRWSKIQVLSLRQSPFDRRARMATLCVDTAGAGRIGHPVEIDYLGAEIAEGMRDRLFREVGRTDFRW